MKKNKIKYLFNISKAVLYFSVIFPFLPFTVQAGADLSTNHINLPKDDGGWTVFSPSPDTRIVYISADGDDGSGQQYNVGDPQLGLNPFEPSGAVNAFASYAAAFEQTRDGYPDWILFKRGYEYIDTIGRSVRSGRSATEPFLIASWGDTGPMPSIKTGTNSGVSPVWNIRWFALSGIDFYAHTRDYGSQEFVSSEGSVGFNVYINDTGRGEGILVEGCKFRFYNSNIGLVVADGGSLEGVSFRRNLVLDSYSDSQGHSQGMWADDTNNLLLEENIFDHNGWYRQRDAERYPDSTSAEGQATMFNHNTYVASLNHVTFKNNIFMRPASSHNKFTASIGSQDIDLINNLYIDGEIAISVGANFSNLYRFEDFVIEGNVVTDIGLSRPTDRTLGWGMWFMGARNSRINNNYIVHQNSLDINNVFALSLGDTMENIDVFDNVFYNLFSGSGIILSSNGSLSKNINIYDNKIQYQDGTYDDYIINTGYDSTTVAEFWNNEYYINIFDRGWYRNNGNVQSLAEWQSTTGDDSKEVLLDFNDPGRSVEEYNEALGGAKTIEDFIEKVRLQDRYNWDARYKAEVINTWIKNGFEIASYRSDVDNSGGISTADALLTLRNSLGLDMSTTAWQVSSTTGDVNCDGSATSADALLLLRYSLGLDMSGTSWCG